MSQACALPSLLFLLCAVASVSPAAAVYTRVAFGAGNQLTASNGYAAGTANCARGSLLHQLTQFTANFAVVQHEIDTSAAFLNGAPSPDVLRVYNGGEWQFRLCREAGVLSFADLNTIRGAVKLLSIAHPHWLINPGTIFWGFSKAKKLPHNAIERRRYVLNCVTVWHNGQEVNFHCKREANDWGPGSLNEVRRDIWVQSLPFNQWPIELRNIENGVTPDPEAGHFLAPAPPYSNGGLHGNLRSEGIFQVGNLVVGLDICHDANDNQQCQVTDANGAPQQVRV